MSTGLINRPVFLGKGYSGIKDLWLIDSQFNPCQSFYFPFQGLF